MKRVEKFRDQPEYEMTPEDWRTAHLVLKLFEDICRRGIQAVRKDAHDALEDILLNDIKASNAIDLEEFQAELRKGHGLRSINETDPLWKANPWQEVHSGTIPLSILSSDLQDEYRRLYETIL